MSSRKNEGQHAFKWTRETLQKRSLIVSSVPSASKLTTVLLNSIFYLKNFNISIEKKVLILRLQIIEVQTACSRQYLSENCIFYNFSTQKYRVTITFISQENWASTFIERFQRQPHYTFSWETLQAHSLLLSFDSTTDTTLMAWSNQSERLAFLFDTTEIKVFMWHPGIVDHANLEEVIAS